jgi:hypothetical protein
MATQQSSGAEEGAIHFADLPEELLVQICQHIQDATVLASLCLTTRQLNRIVTPFCMKDTPHVLGNMLGTACIATCRRLSNVRTWQTV